MVQFIDHSLGKTPDVEIGLKDHHLRNVPGDQNFTVWKYMDLKKFCSMFLQYNDENFPENVWTGWGSMYFHRPDLFSDPLDSDYSPAQKAKWKLEGEHVFGTFAIMYPHVLRQSWFVNCWNASTCEVKEMWENYTSGPLSVVIKTTMKNLIACHSNRFTTHIGHVEYIEPETFTDAKTDNPSLFYYKDKKNFLYEEEIRILTQYPTMNDKIECTLPSGNPYTFEYNMYRGVFRPIVLDTLIQEVRLHPQAPSILKDFVQTKLNNNGLTKPVNDSDLKDTFPTLSQTYDLSQLNEICKEAKMEWPRFEL